MGKTNAGTAAAGGENLPNAYSLELAAAPPRRRTVFPGAIAELAVRRNRHAGWYDWRSRRGGGSYRQTELGEPVISGMQNVERMPLLG